MCKGAKVTWIKYINKLNKLIYDQRIITDMWAFYSFQDIFYGCVHCKVPNFLDPCYGDPGTMFTPDDPGPYP